MGQRDLEEISAALLKNTVDEEPELTWWPPLGVLFSDFERITLFEGTVHDYSAVKTFIGTRGATVLESGLKFAEPAVALNAFVWSLSICL